ncbi:MAG: hypothetical protein R3288_02210, partial [Woeseiaceae bacterium]|nr:hypothetical protein [Woeseiaceae bacterium]
MRFPGITGKIWPAVLLFAAAGIVACASHETKPLEPFVFKPGVIRHEENDFVIGVERYDTADRVVALFGRDMTLSHYW